MNFYNDYIKRLLDIILSIAAIVVLSPLLLLIGIIVRIQMGSPIIFSQNRIGKDERIFKLYKFRSMTNDSDEKGNLLPESERLTRFGAMLRSTSLDELPELICILKGNMSFIGPRPMPDYYGPFFFEEERKRHSVRGGLIPPDSLSGKSNTSYEEQFEYEVMYAENVTFILDLKVFAYTFKILIDRIVHNYGSSSIERPHLNVYRKVDKE